MKNSVLIISAFTLTLLFTSCDQNKSQTFHFDVTGCSNPWDRYYTADTFSYEHMEYAINAFLTDENIDVNSIAFDFDSTKMELCYACHCKTGQVIIVNIASGKKWKMKNLGFYQP